MLHIINFLAIRTSTDRLGVQSFAMIFSHFDMTFSQDHQR